MRSVFNVACLCLLALPVFGQEEVDISADYKNEIIYAQLDKPFYVSGETIWFKIYILNSEIDEIQSGTLYVDLIDPDNKVISLQKLQIKDRSCFGEIQLPLELKEGYYKFRCYTKWNLNFDKEHIFSKYIPIYNEWDVSVDKSKNSNLEKQSSFNISNFIKEKSEGSLEIDLSFDASDYKSRDTVTLTLNINSDNTNSRSDLSISVYSLEDIPIIDTININAVNNKQTPYKLLSNESIKFKHEKYPTLSGMYNKESAEEINTNLILANFIGKNDFEQVFVRKGKFELVIDPEYSSGSIQLYDLNPYSQSTNSYILTDLSDALTSENERRGDKLTRRNYILKYIEKSVKRKKFQELLPCPEKEEKISNSNRAKEKSYANKVYEANRYNNLKNLQEFIDEVVLTAGKIRVEEDKISFRLLNKKIGKKYENAPVYIVNGYLVKDEQKALEIPFNELVKVEVYTEPEEIGFSFHPNLTVSNGGVISIEVENTFLEFFIEDGFDLKPFKGFEKPKAFKLNCDIRVPNFSPLIYWNPQIITESKKPLKISFPTNDIKGKFLITVEGISEDGKVGTAYATFHTFY